MSENCERIAALEADAETARRRLDVQDDDLAAIRRDVHEIKNAISKANGFFAGAAFAVAALAGLIGAGLTAVWHRLYP
jgi:hypothetical protein